MERFLGPALELVKALFLEHFVVNVLLAAALGLVVLGGMQVRRLMRRSH